VAKLALLLLSTALSIGLLEGAARVLVEPPPVRCGTLLGRKLPPPEPPA
jgi:hypothetical protein